MTDLVTISENGKHHKFIYKKYDYSFNQVTTVFQGSSLFFTTIFNWYDSFSNKDFAATDSKGFLGVTRKELKQEEFWQGLDGYKRSEGI